MAFGFVLKAGQTLHFVQVLGCARRDEPQSQAGRTLLGGIGHSLIPLSD
jgi:hypothetical protein